MAGGARREPAALLWGAGFVCLIAAAVAATRLAAFRVAAGGPPVFSFSSSAAAFAPGSTARFSLRLELPETLMPLCRYSFAARLESQDRRSWSWRVRLGRGRNEADFEAGAPLRGVYAGPAGFLVIEDVFGFSRAALRLAGREELVVYPALPEGPGPAAAIRPGGDTVSLVSRPARNEELLETRRYVPGDDPRRIKWKLAAHSGQLFVRIGEEEPPPGSRLRLLLDAGWDPGLLDSKLVPELVDRLAEASAGLVMHSHARGLELEIGEVGGPLAAAARPEQALAWLAGLSGRPRPEEGWPDVPEANRISGPALLVCLPGCRFLRDFDRLVLIAPPAGRRFERLRLRWEEDLARLKAGRAEAHVEVF